jgi:hypothetical protein
MTVPAIAPLFAMIGEMGAGLQAALAVGSTALNYSASSAQAKAENAAISQANENARVQAISDYDQMDLAASQAKAQATQKMTQAQIDRKKAVATAQASASEGNVGGLSINSLLADIYGQEARIRDGVNQNLEGTNAELTANRDTISRNLTNTLTTRPTVTSPSLLGAGLEATTGILGAYKENIRVKSKLT